ncbi:MAG: hypothetical protein K0S41_2326 [Anaerocolumna sp.]|jgi:hypothetical protein|nr:hypothetical protein [Anaerocolumna sp.]
MMKKCFYNIKIKAVLEIMNKGLPKNVTNSMEFRLLKSEYG